MHEHITGKPAQKRDSLPEEQQQAEEDEEDSCKDYGLAYTLKIHTSDLLSILPYYAIPDATWLV